MAKNVPILAVASRSCVFDQMHMEAATHDLVIPSTVEKVHNRHLLIWMKQPKLMK